MAGPTDPGTPPRLLVAGQGTMIGRAVQRVCALRADVVLATCEPEPDFEDRTAVDRWFRASNATWAIVAAGASGGISRNQREPADLMRNNLLAQTHCLEAASRSGVDRLLYLASSCVYPRETAQPMGPTQLMTGPLEPTSEAFATARLAGLAMCRAYRTQHGVRFVGAIPADIYGPGDDFSPEDSHVVSGMLRRMHEAKVAAEPMFRVWGSGNQRRDFLYVDDLAEACLLTLDRYDGEAPINLSAGQDVTIAELATTIRAVVGFEGRLEFDTSRPDGAPRKTLDGGAAARLGFVPRTTLRDGLERTYRHFLETRDGR
ncbi:MAG TPA: GDP-L-fucose synthase [Vicinamibacterales bacterium]|jgi:GDP-L-fucose synthase